VVRLLRVYAIGMLYAKWMLKNKLFYLYLTLFMPFSILVPFYLISPREGRPYIAVGTIVFTLLSNSLVTACQDLAVDRLLKRVAVLLSKPITPLEYFLGQLFSNAIQTIPAVAATIAALLLAGLLSVVDVPLLLAGLLLGWYLSTAMGYALAMALKNADYNTVVIVSNVVSFVLVFLAPIYYPPTRLPGWARLVAMALPSLHIAGVIGAASGVSYGIDPLVSLQYTSVLSTALTVGVARGMGLKDLY